MNPRVERILLAVVFLVAFGIRLYHIDRFPERNRTADEYAWTWSGITLLTEHTPRAWSWLPGYSEFQMVHWRGDDYRIVKPWLDHPPLFPTYVGAFMTAMGFRDPFSVELTPMRLAVMPLFGIAFLLFYLIVKRLAGSTHALLALTFWAVAPTAVWNGRLVMAEQMMLPLALGGLFCYLKYREIGTIGWLIGICVICAALPLCKAAATAFVLYLFSLTILRREWRTAAAVCIGCAIGLSLYALYGAHFGWGLFRTIMQVQSRRFSNFGGFYALVFVQRVVEKSFMYLPFLLGFLSLVGDLSRDENIEIGLFGVTYAATIAFFLPWNEYGWYIIPLYPVLAFGLASIVIRIWREKASGGLFVWALFSVTYMAWIICDCRLATPFFFRWVYLAFLLIVPFVAILAKRNARVWRVMFGALVGSQVVTDLLFSLRNQPFG